jgi:hypothetical protein
MGDDTATEIVGSYGVAQYENDIINCVFGMLSKFAGDGDVDILKIYFETEMYFED